MCISVIFTLTIICSPVGRDMLLLAFFLCVFVYGYLLEAIPSRWLLNNPHLFSPTQHRPVLIQNGPLYLCYTFRPVLRLLSCMSIQKPYKELYLPLWGFFVDMPKDSLLYCIVLYCIVVGSRRLMPPDALQPKAYCTNPGL